MLDLHLNTNRMRMQHAKTMQTFDVNILPRRGKQHSALRRTFGEQLNAICQLSVLQRKFTYDTFRCRCIWFIFLHSAMYWHLKNAANLFALMNKQRGNRVYLLPWWMLNNVCMYHIERSHRFHKPHSCSRSVVNPALWDYRNIRYCINTVYFIHTDSNCVIQCCQTLCLSWTRAFILSSSSHYISTCS